MLYAGFRGCQIGKMPSPGKLGDRLVRTLFMMPRFGSCLDYKGFNLILRSELQCPGVCYTRGFMASIHVRVLGHRAVFCSSMFVLEFI